MLKGILEDLRDGEWMITEINCYNSSDLGLGTCQCHSHPVRNYYPIQRKKALLCIQQYIADIEADKKRRQAEIQWLDNAIAELTNATA